MDLSPTDAQLLSIDRIDLYKTDEKYDFKLTDILRRRQRPLLMLLNQRAELLYASAPLLEGPAHGARHAMDPMIEAALVEAQRLFREPQPVATIVKQLVINKPGERCALVILENQFCCMRLFRLQKADEDADEVYAALVEPISDPKIAGVDLDRVKGLFRLSKREVDVLDALMSGMTDKEIAIRLTVSVETVRAYLKSIRAKLGVKTRTAIVSTVHNIRGGIPDLRTQRA
jgi:DNA-binding CsgD family transcriptional regulator